MIGIPSYQRWRDEKVLSVARREVRSGRFASARDRLAALRSGANGRDEADYLLGLCESALGHPAAAVEAWGRVPPGSRFGARAAVQRVRLALPLGRFASAEELGPAFDDRALAAEARQTSAFILKVEGRAWEARRIFQEGLRFMPQPVATLREIWKLDHDPLSVELSRRELEGAGRKAPDDDRVWLGRANLATWTGQLEEAGRWLEACRARRPNDPAVWRAWLFRARTAGDANEAWRAIEHLTTADVDPAEVPLIRAWLAARKGRTEEERNALEERVHLCSEDLESFDRLIEICGRSADADRWREVKAEAAKVYARYHDLINADDTASHSEELGTLAAVLGRFFDQKCWASLGSGASAFEPPAGPQPLRDGTSTPLAELFARLRPAGESTAAARSRGPDESVPTFRDDAEAAGLMFVYDESDGPRTPPKMMGGGVALFDFDGDGWLDVFLVQGGRFPPPDSAGESSAGSGDRLFRNRRDGTFEDVTERSGLAAMRRGYGFGVTVGDIDRDGRPDLFVTRWWSYALYRNKGDGTFEDVTEKWGLGGDRDWPTSAAFADFDKDGDLDLYVCHYLAFNPDDPASSSRKPSVPPTVSSPLLYEPLRDHLFRNDGGRFVDVTLSSGLVEPDGRGLGALACDLDGDGRIDIYVANDLTANLLYMNQGGLKFREAGHESGVAAASSGGFQAGMGIACGDLEGDGLPDLAVTNFYGEGTSLFHNLGGGLFLDHSSRTGLLGASRFLLGFGAAFFDADNDGRLDLATANGNVVNTPQAAPYQMPAQLLLGTETGKLRDVSAKAGALWQVPRLGRGLAVGDIDNDGRLDLIIVSQSGPLAFAHNLSTPRHFVSFLLEGTDSNRDAVGAKVTIRAGGRDQTGWRLGGGSYASASDPRVHFGLGDARTIDEVEVHWPSGRVDRHANLAADAFYRIRERDERPVRIVTEAR
jgi:tetratricopeptide (TPR) repeat protein